MYNRNTNKEECLKILDQIEDRIPKRRYSKRVQQWLDYQGKEVPGIYKIQAVKNRRQFDLDITKALEAISNEKEEPEPPQTGYTMDIFTSKQAEKLSKRKVSVEEYGHRSRGTDKRGTKKVEV